MTKIKTHKTPWPTKEVMNQIYEKNLWGGNENEFYSGEGSHNPEIVEPYLQTLKSFLSSFENPLTVCDLGCGDFNVGQHLVKYTKQYFAIDIVPDLIAHNREKFKADNLEFQCLNIVTDELPKGDCLILRQVLQHLSNQEVQEILNKLKSFNYLILSEHVPTGEFIPNLDIISGQGIRLKKKSGLDITKKPFNFKFKKEQELLRYEFQDGKSAILTVLYEIF